MSFLVSALNEIYRKKDDFIFIGLTGRTGSGCSTVAKLLGSDFGIFQESIYASLSGNNYRKNKILYKSLEKNWVNFNVIQVRSVITLILSQEDRRKLKSFLGIFFEKDLSLMGDLLSYLTKIRRINTNVICGKVDFVEFHEVTLPAICEKIRDVLGDDKFVALYQAIGKNLRSSGSTVIDQDLPDKFFTLAKRVEEICKKIRDENKAKNKKTAIVVDAIRSPLEAMYFQDRYASFYLMAISCSEVERKARLIQLGYSLGGIASIDRLEGTGQDIDNREYYSAQNIPACLQRSDIYIHNPMYKSKADTLEYLKRQIVRFISLMHTPGTVTPSATERCMQIAYTAKLNSGCISRQVGAVITDSDYSIKAIGWNDVPSGHVPCNLRNRFDLVEGLDESAYSEYERSDDFSGHIKKSNGIFTSIVEHGRNPSFCFKSEYRNLTGKDNQVHTRALHAEENAFLQVSKYGGVSIRGGFLFSTASPCELCAKKSVQLGVEKIFYIDPYPGIAESHILNGGVNRPEMKIFEGAIGKAFHNLYSPTLPYKDELAAFQK